MATQRLARRLLPRFVDLLNDSSADVPTEAMIDTPVDWAGFQFPNYTIVAPYQFIRLPFSFSPYRLCHRRAIFLPL